MEAVLRRMSIRARRYGVYVTSKNPMMSLWNKVLYGVLLVALLDVIIVAWTMLQIESGVPTPHIGFWDGQVELIIKILSK